MFAKHGENGLVSVAARPCGSILCQMRYKEDMVKIESAFDIPLYLTTKEGEALPNEASAGWKAGFLAEVDKVGSLHSVRF